MTEPVPVAVDDQIFRIEGSSLILTVGEYKLTLKIQGPETKRGDRLQLEPGRTLFDLVLESAKTFVEETGELEFGAADLYHIAIERYPELNIRRNSWNAHMMSSTPDHPSFIHYNSRRKYFRYLGQGKYCLAPEFIPEAPGDRG